MPARVLMVAIGLALASSAMADLSKTNPDFCATVQARLEGTALPAATVDHPTYQAFQESKAEVKPLRTEQFVEFRDAANKRDPTRISCKVKTADHLNEVYGTGSAKGSGTCQAIHREMAATIAAGTAPGALKIRAEDIVFEPDDVKFMGSQWVTPFQFVHGDGGVLKLKSKALFVEWTDIKFKLAPDRFRGAHYCHLIAPEYLQRLMTGAEPLPPKSAD